MKTRLMRTAALLVVASAGLSGTVAHPASAQSLPSLAAGWSAAAVGGAALRPKPMLRLGVDSISHSATRSTIGFESGITPVSVLGDGREMNRASRESAAGRFLAADLTLDRSYAGEGSRPSAAPYVIGGALIGAAAMALGIAVYFESGRGQDSLTPPLAYAPAVLGAAAVGAGAGWLVHRILYR